MASDARDAKGASPAVANETPTKEQLQFARAVYIVLNLWPALRQAVLEGWGGPESGEKRDFLLSHLCDEYGNGGANTKPDLDDLIELIESYIAEEYDCQLEDDSAMWVAMHVCGAHKTIFEEGRGDVILAQLEDAFAKAGKTKVPSTTQRDEDEDEDEDEDDDDDEMDEAPAAPRPAAPQAEPEIDEDGFETVMPRRRR
ncbi:rRNA accumulation- protein [Malassezia japonica]|uniref:rRNA accumulation- protein n=1 Tax=Malassezia japonica TaxID=223818 RepID=A0AAF0JB97_9BASI|nr:rRNA accumulation- protein [Malassezia japonica]WFD39674.1 rRNA accumulation- protein [Malassezia japonica]